MCEDSVFNAGGCAAWITMRPTNRLRYNAFDELELEQIGCVNLHCFCRRRGKRGVAPENRSSCLRRSDSVDRIFKHQDAVGDTHAKRTTTAALADDNSENWRLEL